MMEYSRKMLIQKHITTKLKTAKKFQVILSVPVFPYKQINPEEKETMMEIA